MKLNIYTNPYGLEHDTAYGHPECPERLETILNILKEPIFSDLQVLESQAAEDEWIEWAHPSSYIHKIQDLIPDHGCIDVDGEVILSPHSYEAATYAVGALCQATHDVLSGECQRAFCAVRPPGHHAIDTKAMGFCIFSNIFIAARYAQLKFNIGKVAIIDFDVHHGNGTDYLVRNSENIFFISSHQMPLYPGTGDPKYDIPEKIMNIPLSPGSGSREFKSVYEETVFPAIHNYKPELILISAGFDAHKDDPLANINLTQDDYKWITDKLSALSAKYCDNRIVSTLEGGYNLDALKNSVKEHLLSLADL
jgi:acetoin utilization deacetylase AcuC-like enzyme